MLRLVALLCLCLSVAGCGGGGGGGAGTGGSGMGGGTTPPPATLANFATITIDGGPAELQTGPDGTSAVNSPFVSVTLCAPGTSTCQTIDHVIVDTGSIGVRIVQSVISPAILAALPNETDPGANPVGECYGYVDGYVFGSVRKADFKIGGEAVANMPLQVIGDTGRFSTVPASCSAGGGINENTVKSFGGNGIIGIGVTSTDCGAACERAGGASAAAYYSCPASGCAAIIARSSSAVAPFEQLPNPVAAMPVDNNGTLISVPEVPATGTTTATGTLYFGIGTQTNNRLGNAKVLTTSTSSSSNGAGLVTTIYKGDSLDFSFIDSGSNLFFFTDSTIRGCAVSGFEGFYCPPSPTQISPVIRGANGATASAAFTLNNAQNISRVGYSVLPGLGADGDSLNNLMSPPDSFDFGFPFFYGRKIYTAIEGRSAEGQSGPFFAF